MNIRLSVLIITVVVLSVASLFRPRVGLYGYIWYAVVGPDIIAWAEGRYPFSFVLAVTTLIGSIPHLPRLPAILRMPTVRWFLVFQIPLLLSVVFSQGPFLAGDRYLIFEKMSVMVLLVPLLLATERDMRGLLITLAVSELLLGARFGLFGIVHGGALLVQSYGGLYDSNQLALAIAIMIPICWYCRPLVASWWANAGLLGILVCSAAAVVMTSSRGCSLAMAAAFLWVVYHSKRRVGVLIVLVLAIGPGIYLVRDQYVKRMETIAHYQEESSAAGRLLFWKAAVAMWRDHPVLGVGLGGRNYAVLSQKYLGEENIHVVHNSYLEMLVDSGIMAFLIYCGLLFGTIARLEKSIRRLAVTHPGKETVPMALEAALVTFAVGSTFYSVCLYDLAYFLIMASAVWFEVEKDILDSPESGLLAAHEPSEPLPIPA